MAFEITAKIEAALKKLCDLNGDGRIEKHSPNGNIIEQNIFDKSLQKLKENGSCCIMGKTYEIFSETGELQEVQIFQGDEFIAKTDAIDTKPLERAKKDAEIAEIIKKGNESIRNKVVTYKKIKKGKLREFNYSQSAIEDYIVKNSEGGRFAKIPFIKLQANSVSDEDRTLLKEFNNLVKYIISAANDYGVDPKLIVSIIHQEVGFDGLSSRVTGPNGKGYMQITPAPVKDILGGYTDRKTKKLAYEKDLKIKKYGDEIITLLQSRKIITDPDSLLQGNRKKMFDKIWEKLKENNDPDFNIRLGTLILRYYLDRADGDIKLAATNYNGHPKHKIAYGKAVKGYYNELISLTNG